MKELDCRGQACPLPVIQLRDVLEQGKPAAVTIFVDNEAAKENVSRFLLHQGYQVTAEEINGDFKVTGAGVDGAYKIMNEQGLSVMAGGNKKIVVLITSDRMGHGDDELGTRLLINFLKTLKEMGPDLWRLVFMNNGVKLTVENAESLPALHELTEAGVSILVCGACLNHFHLLDKKQVGETSNMLDIVTSLQLADSVINI